MMSGGAMPNRARDGDGGGGDGDGVGRRREQDGVAGDPYPVGDPQALVGDPSPGVLPAPRIRQRPPRLEPLLTVAQVAELLHVPPKAVYNLGIRSVRVGVRAKRWLPSDIRAWIEERRQP